MRRLVRLIGSRRRIGVPVRSLLPHEGGRMRTNWTRPVRQGYAVARVLVVCQTADYPDRLIRSNGELPLLRPDASHHCPANVHRGHASSDWWAELTSQNTIYHGMVGPAFGYEMSTGMKSGQKPARAESRTSPTSRGLLDHNRSSGREHVAMLSSGIVRPNWSKASCLWTDRSTRPVADAV
jgi:hypothetical protein